MNKTLDLGVEVDTGRRFKLPIDTFATGTHGVLAKKRAGKSNAAVVMAEQVHRCGVTWCAIDPKGDWWGVRSGGDGDPAGGLGVPVFGGRHGDLPIEGETAAGATIAALVVDGLSCVIDVSMLSDAGKRRFLVGFADYLFFNNELPVALFLDEADRLLPQSKESGDNAMLHSWVRLVKEGGFRGIGVTMISQRSALLHKNVLTQIDDLIVLNTKGPNDRKVIREWVADHDDREGTDDLIGSLPKLAKGEAWLWMPDHLEHPVRVQFDRRRTFDSGATPEVGQARREPKGLADVDLPEIGEQMAAMVERAKADDPKELRRRVAQLERERDEAKLLMPEPERVEVEVEVPVVPPGLADALADTVRGLTEDAVAAIYREVATRADLLPARVAAPPRPAPPPERDRPAVERRTPAPARPSPAPPADLGDYRPRKGAQRMLEAMARFHPGSMTQSQVAAAAKIKKTGGTFGTYWSELRRHGLIVEAGGDLWAITDAGFETVGLTPDATPMTRGELVDMWMGKLREGARRMLAELVASWPEPIARTELAERAGITVSGGTFGTYLGDLRRTGLVEVEGDRVSMAEVYDLAV